MVFLLFFFIFFFKQKTAYEMRISDWSSDVCSSDLESKVPTGSSLFGGKVDASGNVVLVGAGSTLLVSSDDGLSFTQPVDTDFHDLATVLPVTDSSWLVGGDGGIKLVTSAQHNKGRSEEHTSELQSLMRISYAVFCLKK